MMSDMPVGERKYGPSSVFVGMNTEVAPRNRDKLRELIKLETEEGKRGQGYGTTLLRRVCKEADQAHKTLLVHVDPQDGRTVEQLSMWYEQFGFVPLQHEPAEIMVRIPR